MTKYRGLLFVLLVALATGCSHYYRVTTKPSVTPEDIRWEAFNDKYIILHYEGLAWHLDSISVDTNRLTGKLSSLPSDHFFYLRTNPQKSNKFIRNRPALSEVQVLKEVHIYTSDYIAPSATTADIDFSTIKKMEVYYYDARASTASYLVPALVIPAVVAGGIALIVALTKSSCPYVYIHNGTDFDFSGEIYSGSVYASLERDDYLPLPGFSPHRGTYKLKIANKLPEKQFLNLTELWVIGHDSLHDVLIDRHGTIQTFSSPARPVSALTAGGTEVRDHVSGKDGQYYMFSEEPGITGDSMAMNQLVLQFPLPENAENVKLILRAKNSVWGDYTYGEFTKLFGERYSHWIKVQGKLSPDRHIQWKKDQGLVLSVYLETETGWRFVDYYDMAGPLAFRDLVMAIDIRDAKRDLSGDIRIKLSSGFLFWELDFAGLDCSKNERVAPIVYDPVSAVNQDGKNVRKEILEADKNYYEQPVPGNEVVIDFHHERPGVPDHNSVFLHVRGYYEHIRNYTNQPEKEILTEFLKPGMLSRFSFEKFTEAREHYSFKTPGTTER